MLALAAPDIALWADEPLSTGAFVLGSSVYAVLGVLAVLALMSLPLRGVGLFLHLVRWAKARRVLRAGSRAPIHEPPPLRLDGLSPGLARLARQTRTLALELRRAASRADVLPEDADDLHEPASWWNTLLGEGRDFAPVLAARREVFDWLESANTLPAGDRAVLEAKGADPDHVREVLTRTSSSAGAIRDLAGLFHTLDEQLGGGWSPDAGYRGGASATQQQGERRGASVRGHSLGHRPVCVVDEEECPEHPDAVLRAHREQISRVVRRYARTEAEREDLEQDIALEVWKALPSFRGESRLDTFICRIARYRCYRALRRRGRSLEEDGRELEPADTSGDPEALLLRADDHHRLERALQRLPGTLVATLSLHLRGLSYAEIADELGITERNVSVRLTRARRKLRLALA